jgi:hypothetical protein
LTKAIWLTTIRPPVQRTLATSQRHEDVPFSPALERNFAHDHLMRIPTGLKTKFRTPRRFLADTPKGNACVPVL